MLPASHDRAYQDFLTLLTKFLEVSKAEEAESMKSAVRSEFSALSSWFEVHLAPLDDRSLDSAISARWQSVQTEILREFKLLSTDILFLAAAKKNLTQQQRQKSIESRLSKLIGYCQIMLEKDSN